MSEATYYRVDTRTSFVHAGQLWRVPRTSMPLNFRYPSHRALRAFIFYRDGFQCRRCGTCPDFVPLPYDGRLTLRLTAGHWLVVDHIVPREQGGSAHPDNLQTLCDACNVRKGQS